MKAGSKKTPYIQVVKQVFFIDKMSQKEINLRLKSQKLLNAHEKDAIIMQY